MLIPVDQVVLQSCGVAKAQQANQPQEEEGVQIVGHPALVRVDGGLENKRYGSYDERHNLEKTRIEKYRNCPMIARLLYYSYK